eukprot:TRINITY_DN17670_c0_g1_i1.p1 TRINITY_DN17670_c0_g1~~TRINITY_DN17670_c0_g1_i1.p1  ORF type:complete len:456 (-),score=38.97 TRINITY_DN17670_c0_g1_i1:11-1378(-)
MAFVLTWGKGANGELGLPPKFLDGEHICPFPTRVPGLEGVVDVSAGEGCSAAVTAEGELFTWGSGRGGRLGHGGATNFAVPTKVKALAKHRVRHVAVGENHVACVADNGSVFTWGKGNHGCLGHGDASDSALPAPAFRSANEPLIEIRQVACGFQNTAAVSESGVLYTWGDGAYGKLGHGDTKDRLWPTPVDNLPPIRFVALGSLYTAAISCTGELFLWGYGGAGNLGQGNRRSSLVPLKVAALSGIPVATVACTVGQINPVTEGSVEGKENPHTLMATEAGELYAFGSCHKGMLGNMAKKCLAPKGCDELLPYKVGGPCKDLQGRNSNYLAGMCAVQVASASIHSAVACSDGTAYTFGCGSDGRMGVKKYMEGLSGGRSRMKCYISSPTPIEVDQTYFITKIGTARRHMIALAQTRREAQVPTPVPPPLHEEEPDFLEGNESDHDERCPPPLED